MRSPRSFSGLAHRTQHIVLLRVMTYYNKRIQSSINKGKAYGVKSGENKHELLESSPGGIKRICLSPLETSWDNK